MESPTALIRRAPRWAVYVSGGVVAGAFALRMYRNRTTSTGDTTDPNTTPDPATIGAGPAYGVGGASPGVIVPPVIIGGTNADEGGTGLAQLQTTYFGGLQDLFGAFGDITGGLLGQNSQLIDAQTGITGALLNSNQGLTSQVLDAGISLVAGAGSPPQPAAVNPTPIVANVPVPASAPAPAPAPAPPVSPCGNCGGSYPFCNEANHLCYTVACASGLGARRKGRWHLYANSANDQWMGATC